MNTDQDEHRNEELIKIRTVMQMVALSRTAVYVAMRAGTFPRQRRLGLRSVAWVRSEIEGWIASRPRKKSACDAQ